MSHGISYQCRVVLYPEPTGGYSAHATDLPGVVSQGKSVAQATANMVESFRAAIKAYRDENLDIPWAADPEFLCPSNAIEKWIIVNA